MLFRSGSAGQGQTCNAISIGIGFTGKEIKPPSVVGTAGPAKDACSTSDAGVDSSTGDDDSGADAAQE